MFVRISNVYMNRSGWLLVFPAVWLLLCSATPPSLTLAATWDGSDDANWNTPGNWDVAPGVGADLVFSAAGQTFQPLNNDIVGGSFNSITFDADVFTNDVGGDNLLTVSGNSFALDAGGISASNIGAGRTIDVQNDIVLNASTTITNLQSNTVLILSGAISGAFNLNRAASSPGVVRLTGNSSFSGGVTINSGGLVQFTSVADAGNNSSLGSAGLISIRNTLEYIGTDPAGHSTNRAVAFGNGGTGYNFLNASGAGPLTFTGQFGNASPRNVQLAGTGVGIVTGVVTAAGAATYTLSKNGTGTWILGGASANNITRARVQTGTLILAKNNALGTGVAAGNQALVESGATLGFQGNINHSTAKPVLVSGAGDAGNGRAGAIDNISGVNSFAGNITLAGNTTLGASAGQLTLSGLITEDLISNSYEVTKNGPGTIVLSRAAGNTYQGGTVITQGSLLAANTSGSATGSGAVTIGANGTLGGSGIIGGAIVASGTISPGFSPGTLTTLDDVTFADGSEYLWQINDWTGVQSTNYDYLDIGGALSFTATAGDKFILNLQSLDNLDVPGVVDNFDPYTETSWVIATAAGGISGLTNDNYFISLMNFQPNVAGSFYLSLENADTQLVLNYLPTPAPEPGSLGLLAAGSLLVLGRRRKR